MIFRGTPKKVKSETKDPQTVWQLFRDSFIKKKRCCLFHHDRKAVAHHPDYSKPLHVVWLCRKCHAAAHMGLLRIEDKHIVKYRDLVISDTPVFADISHTKYVSANGKAFL